MPTFYIVPPRKTQLGETGISIGGIDGIITNLPNNAPITGFGALKLDQGYSPTWTGIHIFENTVIFNENVTFSNDQQFNISSFYIPGQSAGDLIFFNGVSWTRRAISPNVNSVLVSSTSSVQWSKSLNLSTTETNTLKINNLNGVLKASSGIVSGSSSIEDLSNVQLNSPEDNQFLKYNESLDKWENANVPLPDRSLIIRFLNGATPVNLGPDQEIAIVPYEPSDGTSVLTFTVNRITFLVETESATEDCIIRMQRVAANTEFPDPSDPLADFITELTLPAGDSQVFISTNDPLFNETISSGQKLRLVIDSIGENSSNWTVQLEASALSLYQQPAGVVPISMGGTGRTTMGTANTVLTVGNYGDKLIYKDLIAGDNITIVSAPIEVGGNEIGGTITISSTLPPGFGNGTVYSGNAGELAYYANSGSTVVGANNLIWNNSNKKLNIASVPASWNTSSISVLIGNTSFTSGNSYGTVFGINLPNSPVFTGNFFDLQINNASKFTINYEGNLSANKLIINSAEVSTSYTTGALIVSGGVGIAGNLNLSNPLSINNGGTGLTSVSAGQLLIGNTSGSFTANTLTGSGGINITNGDGTININNTAINSINGLTSSVQIFTTSTSGINFEITSTSTSHTFVLPDASSSARGVVNTGNQTISGVKTFSTAINSQKYYADDGGYFGGDPSKFTIQGTTGSIYFGILKSDLLNRFAGMKVEEKPSPVFGPDYLYGDIVFYTDSEAQDYSTERLRIDGAGLITAANDVTINGELTLSNNPLSVSSGGTGTSVFNNGELLIGNSTTSSLNKATLTAGNGIQIDNGPGSVTVSALQSKSISILSPTNTDDITLFYTDKSLNLQKAAAIVRGTTASVTYSIYYDQNRISTSATVVLSTTASSINNATTTGQITNFSSNNAPLASSSIWLKITSVSNADEFHLTLFYK